MSPNELTIDLLIRAYASGYFPMPDPSNKEILWYRPDPRAVFELDGFHVSRKLRKKIEQGKYSVGFSSQFELVMRECSNRKETWITEEFIQLYTSLHHMGFAHCVEIFDRNQLVGGAYGVCIGAAFFAESMFHKKTDCSKLALYHLIEKLKYNGFDFMECQFMTSHLASLGAVEINDVDYRKRLETAVRKSVKFFES